MKKLLLVLFSSTLVFAIDTPIMTDNLLSNFLTGLNKALALEYAAAIQYLQHAAVITGAKYVAISKEILKHSQEEMNHAVLISQIIDDFNETPTVDVAKREISLDSKTMLEQDLAGEEIAIVLYKELIAMAQELKEFGYKQTLEGILVQEEEHRRDLRNALGL